MMRGENELQLDLLPEARHYAAGMSLRLASAQQDPPRDTYFHGTRGAWKPGDILLPRRDTGAAETNAPLVPGGNTHPTAADHVYVTRRYLLA